MSATVADATRIDTPSTDPDAIGQMWDALVEPGEVFEARAPKTRKGPRRLYGAASGYFDDRDAFVREVEHITGADAQAVYMTLNPVNPALLARAANRFQDGKPTTTSDADVILLRHLLIDIDPVRPADISATDAQRDEAVAVRDLIRRYLRDELDWPHPKAITMSGNGGGLLYLIDLPNTAEATALLHRVLQGLSALFSTERVTVDTTTHNAARITKIVGTVAAKGDPLPDYPWRTATGRFNPDPQPVAPACLEAAAVFAPKPEPRPSPNGYTIGGRSWDIRDVLARNGIGFTEKALGYGTAFTIDRCLTSQDHTAGACILEFPNGALSYTCRHNRCAGKRWEDVRPTLGLPTANGRDYADPPPSANGYKARDPQSPTQSKPDAWPELRDEALYGLAGDVVRLFTPHCEGDPVAILTTFLVAMGNAIGGTPYVVVGETRHYLNQFVATVGETSRSRKGTSAAGPLNLAREADIAWTGRIAGGLSSGEGLILPIRDPVEQVKKGETIIVDPGVSDKRLMIVEEEFSATLKVAARDGNTLTEQLRKAWDGKTLGVMTRNSPLRATSPHVSILAHITLEELGRTFDSTDAANGYGNRFAWFLVRRSKVLPDGGNVPPDKRAELVHRTRDALSAARRLAEIRRDESARAIWHEVYPDLSEGRPGMFGSITARAEAHVLRFSALYAALDGSDRIRDPHLIAALALWDYAEASARRIFGDATGDPIADRVLSALRANGPMAQSAISDLFGRNVSAARLGRALETLLAARMVRSEQEDTGGRPRTIWSAK